MHLGNITISNDKWMNIYESLGKKRQNGYISTEERIKAKKKHRKNRKK